MLKEAGISANELMNAADDVNVRMAIYNGIIRETRHQTGDAAKLASDLGGSLSRTSTSVDYLKNSLGEAIAGPLTELLEIIQPIINGLTEWMEENETLTGSIVVLTTALTGLVLVATSAKLLGGLAALKTSIAALGAAFTFLFTTPVGLATTAIVGLTAAIIKYRSDQKKATEEIREAATANEKQAESLESLRKKYSDIETRLKATKKGTDEFKKLQRELNETIQKIADIAPYVVTSYNNLGEARKININLLEQEIQKTRELARAQEEQLGEKLQNAYVEARLRRDRAARRLEEAIQEGERIRKGGIIFGPNDPRHGDWEKEVARLKNDLQKANKEMEASRESYLNYMVPRRPGDDSAETTTTTPGGGGGGGGAKAYENTALAKAWADFEKERVRLAKQMADVDADSMTDLVFQSYQKQADFLKNNVLIHAKTQAEKDKVESQIFSLMMQRYEMAADKDGWTTQQKLTNLDSYLKGYIYSIDNYNQIDTTRRTLQAQLADEEARAKDETYQKDMERYNKETDSLNLSLEDRKDLYEFYVANTAPLAERSAEARKAIELQLLVFERQIAQEKEELAEERTAFELEQAEKLATLTRNERDKALAKAYADVRDDLDKAEDLGVSKAAIEERYGKEVMRIILKYSGIKNARELELQADLLEAQGKGFEARLKREEADWEKMVTSGEHSEKELKKLLEVHVADMALIQDEWAADTLDQQSEVQIAYLRSQGDFLNAELEEESQRFRELKRSRQFTNEELQKLEEEHQKNMDAIKRQYEPQYGTGFWARAVGGGFGTPSERGAWESGKDPGTGANVSWMEQLSSAGTQLVSAIVMQTDTIKTTIQAFLGGNWIGAIISIISQTRTFQRAMEVLNSFMGPIIALIDAILMPIIRVIANLWNGVINALAGIDIFGWKPFGGLKRYQIDTEVWDKQDEQDSQGPGAGKKSGTQISEITGPTRDILISLLSPLKSLDILPGLFDSMRTAIYEMRDAMLGYNFDLAPAGPGGALGDTFRVDTLVIETSVTNATDLDALMRTMGDKARVVVKGSGR